MTQTMMALLALVLTTTFVVQQHRGAAEMRLGMIRTELAMQGTSVAVDMLDEIGRAAFDEVTAGDRRATSAAALTPESGFGRLDTPHNDLDDFHVGWFQAARGQDGDTLRFGVETYVSYADELNPAHEVDVATRYKKVSVKVYNLDIAQPDTVRLWQAYACGSRCTW